MNEAKLQKIKDVLIELAKFKTWSENDDFNPCDFSGGNFDDAFYGGNADGRTELAREILEMINK